MRELIRVARLRPLKQASRWVFPPNRTLQATQNCQKRSFWAQFQAPRTSKQLGFFSRRDLHYHFSKPPPTSQPSPSGPPIHFIQPPKPPRKWGRWIALLTGAAAIVGFFVFVDIVVVGDTINQVYYVPYEVVSNRAVSSTSFVLTVRPEIKPIRDLPYLNDDGTWWDFLWTVQVKQPELQIQREYTPLPPFHGEDPGDGTLSLYVRRCDGGEVSTYLSKLKEGDIVELRMGSKGFDFSVIKPSIPSHFICLAGGTGIATALQIAHIVFKNKQRLHRDTNVSIIWATRSRDDVYVNTEVYQAGPEEVREAWVEEAHDEASRQRLGPKGYAVTTTIMARLAEVVQENAMYGIPHAVLIDGVDSPLGAGILRDALMIPETVPRNENPRPVFFPVQLPYMMAASCRHDNNVGLREALGDDVDNALPGKVHNAIFVSGPEGFVDKFAGKMAKHGDQWYRSGGMLGDLNSRFGSPDDPWLVLGFP